VNLEKLWNFRKKWVVSFVLVFTICIYTVSQSLEKDSGKNLIQRNSFSTSTVQATVSPEISNTRSLSKVKLGHFSYQEAELNNLVVISSYAQQDLQRFEKLNNESALALMKMIYSARDDGVWIIPVSGFRSVDNQSQLFQSQVQKRGSEKAAAKISAPPGYSEHHTGYAIDVADGNFPRKDTTLEFQRTDAFKWLVNHANEFHFEMSFPENNSQGVSYEPWHWRFMGTQQAKAVFDHTR
jgi:zinc D-Ala-D-Ala carboxypeptidase